jgi:hypothetical protein
MDDENDKSAHVTSSTQNSAEASQPLHPGQDAWERMRGILKDVYAELGGGEAFIRNERESFYSRRESK